MLKEWSIRLVLDRETYLVRHALNFPKSHINDIDTALTLQGIEQARILGQFFLERGLGESAIILCSDLKRTTQTAVEIAKVIKPIIPPIISKELTRFPDLGDTGMDLEIERAKECFGDFRGYFEKILQNKCPDYEKTAHRPLIVVTQAPVIARIMGLNPKDLAFACVYQYPAPDGIPKNLVASLIN